MRALDVHIAADRGEELPQDRVDLLAIPAASRPLEVLWRDAAFVARVPRVKLFVEEPADWYGSAETCRRRPDWRPATHGTLERRGAGCA